MVARKRAGGRFDLMCFFLVGLRPRGFCSRGFSPTTDEEGFLIKGGLTEGAVRTPKMRNVTMHDITLTDQIAGVENGRNKGSTRYLIRSSDVRAEMNAQSPHADKLNQLRDQTVDKQATHRLRLFQLYLFHDLL